MEDVEEDEDEDEDDEVDEDGEDDEDGVVDEEGDEDGVEKDLLCQLLKDDESWKIECRRIFLQDRILEEPGLFLEYLRESNNTAVRRWR